MKALLLLFPVLFASYCSIIPTEETAKVVPISAIIQIASGSDGKSGKPPQSGCKSDSNCKTGEQCEKGVCVSKCKSGFVFTKEVGCIRSCSNPDFKNCADVFPLLYDPKFCAFAKNGSWVNFTFDCQACGKGNTQFIGVSIGMCTGKGQPLKDPCRSDKDCKTSQYCHGGVCFDKCTNVFCDKNQVCQNGKCIKKTPTVPACPKCQRGYHCEKYVCVPDSPLKPPTCNKVCKSGYHCESSTCVPDSPRKCKNNGDCGVGEKCKSGICIDKCQDVNCPSGQFCSKGICKKLKCSDIDCPKGTSCENGKCVPDIQICPTDTKYNATVCISPRPTQAKCPAIYYTRALDPQFCGVQANGERVDFVRECEACKDTSIVYFFDVPCSEAPFVCDDEDSCRDYYPSKPGCKSDHQCPFNWQICFQGNCIDRCATLRCASGSCRFGQCAYQQPSGKCDSSFAKSGCAKDHWSCIGTKCVDQCLKKFCPKGKQCNNKNGKCE